MVVVAIFASVVFIQFVNTQPNYREAFVGGQKMLTATQAQLQAVQTKAAADLAGLTMQVNQLQEGRRQDQTAKDTLQGQLSSALADKAQLTATVEQLKADLAGLNASLDTLAKMQDILQKQLTDARA
jgi:chromosome segregation ATPase